MARTSRWSLVNMTLISSFLFITLLAFRDLQCKLLGGVYSTVVLTVSKEVSWSTVLAGEIGALAYGRTGVLAVELSAKLFRLEFAKGSPDIEHRGHNHSDCSSLSLP